MNDYILSLNKEESFPKMKEYASLNSIPIIMSDSLLFIEMIINLQKVKRILEVGTAIAYSAIHFASVDQKIIVDTIERNREMIALAQNNINEYGFSKQIVIHEGNALEIAIDEFSSEYDLLFIDAANAQYQKFFERYSPLVRKGGIIITDNIIFHGCVDTEEELSKNVRNMVRKINNYNEWLKNNQDYDTTFFAIGDGLAVSVKK